MADGYFQSIMNWLRGPQPTPSLGLEQAPALPAYPSQADADHARHFGFADGSINEDFLNNNKARVFGGEMSFKGAKPGEPSRKTFVPAVAVTKDQVSLANDPKHSPMLDLNAPQNADIQDDTRNVMMRAALAANRSPIAAMGFDPSRVTMDVLARGASVGGMFNPSKDSIFTSLKPDDSIVHESTHRGIQKLLEKYPEEVSRIAGAISPRTDEMIVRWLMHSKAGDPEGFSGSADARQRQEAIDMFGANKPYGKNNKEIVRQLEELAIQDRLTRSRRSGPQ